MRQILIFFPETIVLILAVCLPVVPSWSANNIAPPGINVLYIDTDGDGYGVESPAGPDCDDSDPAVHKPAGYSQAQSYIPQHGNIYYIATDGDNMTGAVNNPEQPFASASFLESRLQPDDVVVFREGRYNLNLTGALVSHKGRPGHPITFMAYPGEAPVFERYDEKRGPNNSVIGGHHVHDLVYDGLITENAAMGGDFAFAERIVIKNCVFRKHLARGFFAMQGLKDWLVTGSTFHDTSMKGTHGMYLGCREAVNANIVIRHCLFYRNGRTGFQHNGRVTGLRFEDNIVHSNNLSGISLVNGVSKSIFCNNLIFNNNKQAVVIQTHHNPGANEIAYPDNDNLFVNNTFWVGRENVGIGRRNPELFPCIEFNPARRKSGDENSRYRGNRFVNNICVTSRGPFVKYYNIFDHYQTAYVNNLFRQTGKNPQLAVRANKGDGSEDSREGQYSFWSFATAFTGNTIKVSGNLLGNPGFVHVSADDALHPERFNFKLSSASKAVDRGMDGPEVPRRDIAGRQRDAHVDIGAYERQKNVRTLSRPVSLP